MQLLGQGTFGKVVKAIDVRTQREVAVKIIRAVPKVGVFGQTRVGNLLTGSL